MRTRTSCPCEAEVLDLLVIGQWPARADAELRGHASSCPICSDLIAVASAMVDLGNETSEVAGIPDAGLVWYRAQTRAREDMARRAARPVTLVATAAVLCTVGVSLLVSSVGAPVVADWWAHMPRGSFFTLPPLPAALWDERAASVWGWIGLAVLAWIAVIPAAFYLARMADGVDRPQPGPRHGRS